MQHIAFFSASEDLSITACGPHGPESRMGAGDLDRSQWFFLSKILRRYKNALDVVFHKKLSVSQKL